MLSWITSRQAQHVVRTSPLPLREVANWVRTPAAISHELGLFFSIIAVDITTNGREVAQWTQPLVRPHGAGVVALLVKRVDGVLHALLNARVEPGYLDVVELAPTVQCTPDNYVLTPTADRPPFLDMHNRMKECLVLLGRLEKAVVRPPLMKLSEAEIAEAMGAVSGWVIDGLYIAGDTIWCEEVA